MIAADRAQGFTPAFVIASAGTVNSGAIDDLAAIGAIARAQNLWFHVDGAFGGLARMVPELRHRLAGIERADSIAFDFHKWLQVPYDAGCVLVRDGELHRRVFSTRREYLAPAGAALGGGDPWFCEYGPEMSRGFRALKVWFTLKAYGTERLAEVIARNCRQAAFLGDEIGASKELELVAPVSLNIACFRYVADGVDDRALDTLNADIVAELQSSGIAAPSTTRLDGKTAIRVCLTNHRTQSEDLIVLLRAVETIGRVRSAVLRPRRRA